LSGVQLTKLIATALLASATLTTLMASVLWLTLR